MCVFYFLILTLALQSPEELKVEEASTSELKSIDPIGSPEHEKIETSENDFDLEPAEPHDNEHAELADTLASPPAQPPTPPPPPPKTEN